MLKNPIFLSSIKKLVDKDSVIEAAVQSIPYVGGPLATLYYGNKQEKRFKRLEKFYEELREEFSKFQNNFADISSHNPDELSAILTRIPKELHKQIKMLAVLQDTSVNQIVTELLEEYVKEHEKEAGESEQDQDTRTR